MHNSSPFIHQSSYIDDDVSIGDGTKIWHFCHIMSGVTIGKNCNLGQNVFIGKNVRIGNNVKIQNNVSVYEGVTIEDDVFLGPSMVFTNVINPRSHVNRRSDFKPTLVRKGTSIGANATIVCGHTLGYYSFIGAGSTITKDVKDYALMVGNPAVQSAWMCHCGVKLIQENANYNCANCMSEYILREDSLIALNTQIKDEQ